MKRFFLISFLLTVFQSVFSIVSANDVQWWYMAALEKGENTPAFYLYAAANNDTIDGISYFHIEDYTFRPESKVAGPVQLPYGYRMADKKIYIYDFDSHKESVAFDFTLTVGDHFTTYNGIQWEVVAAKDTLVNISECGLGNNVSKRLLTVKTVDGSMTDQWLEDFGSFANHFMIRNMDDVVFAHTLWMEYDDGVYLAREISADPFYAHASKWQEDDEDDEDVSVNKIHETFTEYSYEMGKLTLASAFRLFGHRYYSCYYRMGDSICRVSFEQMRPDEECPLVLKTDTITFVGVPEPTSGSYTICIDKSTYSTGIRPVVSSSKEPHRIYDAQGRQLPAKPRRGLYIQDGVKCIAK